MIETAVSLDSPFATWVRIQRVHLTGRTPVSKVAVIYFIETGNLCEERLVMLCGDVVELDHARPDDAKFEHIFLAVALRLSIPPLLPSAANHIS